MTGQNFHLFRAGSLGMLNIFVRLARKIAQGENEIFPAWQGMLYMHNMFDGRAKLELLDNGRYPGMHWTTVRDVLSKSQVRPAM